MIRLRGVRLWFVIAALAQALVLTGYAAAQELSLRRGTEIVLQTVPVDPRDLFRGDYVVLRYTMTRISGCYFSVGSTIYVPLEPRGDVFDRLSEPDSRYSLLFSRLEDARWWLSAGPNRLVLRGRVESAGPNSGAGPACQVAYGIESYFVPEGTGRRLEQMRGELKVRVSVNRVGAAKIVGVTVPE